MEYVKDLPDKAFDLAIVDPPYGAGNNFAYKGEDRFKKFENEKPGQKYFNELFRISKNQIIWGGNYFAQSLPETNAWVIWDKNNGESLMSDGEMAWTSFDKLLKIIKIHWTGSASLWEDTKGKIHICQKPVKLYEWLLDNYAEQGNKILDTHLGSGSIAIACDKMGFDLVGCEIDKDYYDGACKRLKEHQDQLTLAV